MSEDYSDGGLEAYSVPLHSFHGRASAESTNTLDFDRLLSDDVSEASSTDLPPIDGGRAAWTCLLGCWLIEAMIWGFPISFGVFQHYYTSHALFKDSNSIPTIGTLATGVSYLGMPFANPIALRWPQHRRKMCATGWALCLVGLVAASFATQAWQLLFFQGLVYGMGWFVCYTPFLFILNQWWVEKRGMAYGILFASSGVSGLIIPLAIDWVLEGFGFRTALRVYAVATVVLSGPGLLLIRPRHPTSPQVLAGKSSQVGAVKALTPFATNMHFLLFAGAVFFQGLGFFIPNIFIPSFAVDLGISTRTSSGLLALISVSQVLGQLWQGWISDRVNVYIPTAISALAPGLAALLLWGPAVDMAYLAPFAVIWGFFSASYSVLYTRMVSFLFNGDRRDMPADERIDMLVYGFFSFERGLSNIIEGPISSWLIGGADNVVDRELFGVGRYAYVIWFTIFCMIASSLVGVGWLWRGTCFPQRV